MGYPNRNNKGGSRGGGGNYGRSDFGGNRPIRHTEMHKAVCSTCGNECEVPFRPSGDKPVYCRDCFAKNRSHDKGYRNETPRPEYKRFNDEKPAPTPTNHDLDAINSKLDQILKILSSQTETIAPIIIPSEPAKIEKKKRVSKKAVSTPEETPAE